MVRDDQGNEEKVSGRLFHDFRRKAVRDMIRFGIPERVTMTIPGHKTRSVFDRYNIVSDQDLREGAKRMQVYHNKQAGSVKVTENKPAEVVPFNEAQNG